LREGDEVTRERRKKKECRRYPQYGMQATKEDGQATEVRRGEKRGDAGIAGCGRITVLG
jgi:hypothetical protein